jgi:probable rRNA maturation factor
MEPLVDVVIEDARWEEFGLQVCAELAARAVFAEIGLPEAGFTMCIMGCDDARIAELNGDFRAKPTPTNVLSWPSEERAADSIGAIPALPNAGSPDGPEHLGDIAIAFDTCKAEAIAADKPMGDHTTHLVVHGILHLLGYDHIQDADGDLMEAVEIRVLARLGLSDPYQH